MEEITNPEDMPVLRQFDLWLNDRIMSEEINRGDLLLIMVSMFARMRHEWTFEELHMIIHIMLERVEAKMQQGTMLIDPRTMEASSMLLAEERRELGMDKLDVPDTVPEGWLDDPEEGDAS
jgi:hypothetical protein